ncbi:collagen-like protein [bacterium]|nr:collagen-like protein [bacterium]
MSIEEVVYSRLTSDDTLVGMVAYIRPTEPAENDDARPELVYTITSDEVELYLSGESSTLHKYGLQIDCWATDLNSALNVLARAKIVLDGWRGGTVSWCKYESQSDAYSDPGFVATHTYTLWANTANVVALPDSTGAVTTGNNFVELAACEHVLRVDCSGLTFDGGPIEGGGGEQGPAGEDGASAYDVAVSNGFSGTEEEWLASLVGPQGEPGSDGADSTVPGPPGEDGADSTVPGPAGADGADGASAYEVALANGFSGTAEEWLASLVGPQGEPGADGADSTVPGPKGDTGDTGPAGPNTVTTSTTTNLTGYLKGNGSTISAQSAPLPITEGGTGANNVIDAVDALGLTIGAQVQAYDPDLAAIAAISSNGVLRRTAANTWGTYTPVPFYQTADVTVANTSSETTVTGSGVGSLTLAANYLAVYRVLRVKALGYWASTGSRAQWRIKLGSTTLATNGTGAVFLSNGASGFWEAEFTLICRTGGSSGTIIGGGQLEYVTSIGSATQSEPFTMTNTTTIDTTATQTVDLTVAWAVGASGNTLTCTTLTVESMY